MAKVLLFNGQLPSLFFHFKCIHGELAISFGFPKIERMPSIILSNSHRTHDVRKYHCPLCDLKTIERVYFWSEHIHPTQVKPLIPSWAIFRIEALRKYLKWIKWKIPKTAATTRNTYLYIVCCTDGSKNKIKKTKQDKRDRENSSKQRCIRKNENKNIVENWKC